MPNQSWLADRQVTAGISSSPTAIRLSPCLSLALPSAIHLSYAPNAKSGFAAAYAFLSSCSVAFHSLAVDSAFPGQTCFPTS